jgi:glycosyltransferase involved in cell wall biosynthesis
VTAKTVLQVIPRLETGGSEKATLEIAEALLKAGARALVATEGGRMADAIHAAGTELIDLPVASKNPFTIYANAGRLVRLMQERGVDLIHARSRAPAWSALLAARRLRRPFVTTYHGSYNSKTPLKDRYNSVMARGDRVIANSLFTAGLIAARQPEAGPRIRVVYRGVDFSDFDPQRVSAERVERLRKQWGLTETQTVILHAARLTSWKGQPIVIEAARRLASQGKLGDAVFVFAGGADGHEAYRSKLEAEIAASGIALQLRIVGHCDDMPAAFALAHISLIVSVEAETFGRASAEAQALRCPVIVSDIGATPETIIAAESGDPAYTGWLVPPANAEALAIRLAAVLALSSEQHAAIGARGRAHVMRAFSLAAMQHGTLAVYDELLGTALAAQFGGGGA